MNKRDVVSEWARRFTLWGVFEKFQRGMVTWDEWMHAIQRPVASNLGPQTTTATQHTGDGDGGFL